MTTKPKRCKCGNYIGEDTPANGRMCMECWTHRFNRATGRQQAKDQPDRPGNPLATLDISEHFIPRSVDVRLTEYMTMLGGYEDIDNQ